MSGTNFHGSEMFSQIINDGKTFIANSIQMHSAKYLPEGHPALSSVLGIPIINKDKTIGIIVLGNRAGGFSAMDQETMELFAPFVGEALVSKQTEKILRISEEKFRNLVKYAPTVIFEMDLHGSKFFNVNNTGYETLGYTSEELYSMKPGDLLDEKRESVQRACFTKI